MKKNLNTVLNGFGENEKFAYFFKGDQYIKYDWQQDKPVEGYPQQLSAWKLPSNFQSNIDAAFNGSGAYEGKAYFFKDTEYVRYDWATGAPDEGYPKPIAAWNFPESFSNGIDAALEGIGNNSNKIYFFKNNQYIRYNLNSDTTDDGYPLSIDAWSVKEDFTTGVDAVINGKEAYLGKAYFFKGDAYMRYDWATDTCDNEILNIAGWDLGFTMASNNNANTNSTALSTTTLTTLATTIELPFTNAIKENKEAFIAKVIEISNKLNIPPKWLMGVMNSESGLNHKAINNNGGATGLIQFMPNTIQHVLKTTQQHLLNMSNVEQLEYVYMFYKQAGVGRFKRMTDLYLFTFYPVALGKADDFVLGSESSEKMITLVKNANAVFDIDKDQKITIGEFRSFIIKKYSKSIPDIS
jgi:hypothetical protein